MPCMAYAMHLQGAGSVLVHTCCSKIADAHLYYLCTVAVAQH
jgi:hypothetical protein